MTLRLPLISLAGACVFAAACTERAPPTSDEPAFSATQTVLTGYRLFNWEYGHTLYAIGLDGPICLQTRDSELPEIEDARFAELNGHLSARGSYRGLAQCAYVFDVNEVVQDRALTQQDRAVLGDLMKVVAESAPGEIPGARFEEIR